MIIHQVKNCQISYKAEKSLSVIFRVKIDHFCSKLTIFGVRIASFCLILAFFISNGFFVHFSRNLTFSNLGFFYTKFTNFAPEIIFYAIFVIFSHFESMRSLLMIFRSDYLIFTHRIWKLILSSWTNQQSASGHDSILQSG